MLPCSCAPFSTPRRPSRIRFPWPCLPRRVVDVPHTQRHCESLSPRPPQFYILHHIPHLLVTSSTVLLVSSRLRTRHVRARTRVGGGRRPLSHCSEPIETNTILAHSRPSTPFKPRALPRNRCSQRLSSVFRFLFLSPCRITRTSTDGCRRCWTATS
jgi:hypothetical protein